MGKKNLPLNVDNYMHVISPTWKQIWLMFDTSNGHAKGRTYFWVFGTKKEAMTHRRQQHKMKFHAKLSLPIRISNNVKIKK